MKVKETLKELLDSNIDFKELEKLMWALFNSFQHYLVKILEEIDEILKETRDISPFKKKKNSILSLIAYPTIFLCINLRRYPRNAIPLLSSCILYR